MLLRATFNVAETGCFGGWASFRYAVFVGLRTNFRRRGQIPYAFLYWVCGRKSHMTGNVVMSDIGKN